MTTKSLHSEDLFRTDVKKRNRQSQRRGPIGGDDALIRILFLFILLFWSGVYFGQYDAFQLQPFHKNRFFHKPSTGQSMIMTPTRTNGLFLRPHRRRKRQNECDHDRQVVLCLQNADDKNDSNNIVGSVGSVGNQNSTSTEPLPSTVAEANALRARAKELRAEARVMELELRQRASKERQEKDAIVDEIITTLFLPLQYQDPQPTIVDDAGEASTEPIPSNQSIATITTRIPDARVVADRLRQGKYSRPQMISVVDRIFDRHVGEFDAMNNSQLPLSGEEEQQRQKKQDVRGKLKGEENTMHSSDGRYRKYFQVLITASLLLDEKTSSIETSTASPEATSSSTPVPSSSLSPSNSTSFVSPTLFVNSGQFRKVIESRFVELQKMRQVELNRKFAAETNRVAAMSSGDSSKYSKNNNNGTLASVIQVEPGKTPSFIPLWIPSTYIPYIISLDKSTRSSKPQSASPFPTNSTTANVPFAVVTNSTLESTELEILKNEVLLGSRFYVTSFEFAPGAALFRGNIRTSLGNVPTVVPPLESSKNATRYFWRSAATQHDNNTAMVFADIQERLQSAGLGDKVQLFVLPDPEPKVVDPATRRPALSSMAMRRPGIEATAPSKDEPVILALPKKLTPDESKLKKGWIRRIGKKLSYPLALFSTLLSSFYAFTLNPHFFDAVVNKRDFTVLSSFLPLALGFLSIQIVHEVAHYIVAKRKKIKIGFPVPVPGIFTVTAFPFFGCITPLRSFPKSRSALVDFSLSGPMAALAASLCMVFRGVMLTGRASAIDIAGFPVLSVKEMKSHFLLGSILSWLLPKTMMLPLAQPVPMHPLVVVGRFGMISSAFQLLPIFRLDGGRACFAAMGQRTGGVISACTFLWLISNACYGSGTLFQWMVWIALLQMRVEIPCRDECTEVGGKREWLWFGSFLLCLSILIPFPGAESFLPPID